MAPPGAVQRTRGHIGCRAQGPGPNLSPTLQQPRSVVMSTQPDRTDQDPSQDQTQKSSAGRQDQSQPGTGKVRSPLTDPPSPQSPNDRSREPDQGSDVEGNKPQRRQDEKVDTEKDQERPARMNQGRQDDAP